MDFLSNAKKLGIDISKEDLEKFKVYYEFLVYYNNMVNLTAITKEEEVYIKHFYDSLTIYPYLPNYEFKLCDIGSGAGFPSIPLAIVNQNIKVTIIDALNKRIKFLNELKEKISLNSIIAIHGRAEEYALDNKTSFDVVTARAVGKLNVLAELSLPLVKIGGLFIAMKGSSGTEELEDAKKGIAILGGIVIDVVKLELPQDSGQREIIIIKKIKDTPNKYPRSFKLIKEKPL